jgi:hypothetical protein
VAITTITITILMVKQTIQSVGTNALNNAAILVLGYPISRDYHQSPHHLTAIYRGKSNILDI